MLNEEKVKNMTRAAAYEKGPEKENIQISNYFSGDYLGLQMIKAGIAYTVAFCLLVVLWSMIGTEELMLQLTRADYLHKISKTLVILFLGGLLVYEIVIYIYYSWKCRKAKESVDEYQVYLKNINKFYETQESADDEIVDLDLTDEESML